MNAQEARRAQMESIFDIARRAAARCDAWEPASDDNWMTCGSYRSIFVVETGNIDLLPAISKALEQQGFYTDATVKDGLGVCIVMER